MRCGKHCSLPAHVNATETSGASVYHRNVHTAESIAEMLRPYPLGTIPPQALAVPDAAGKTLEDTLALLSTDFWNADRLKFTDDAALSCEGSFLQRFTKQYQETKDKDAADMKLGDATTMRDLCVAFYYRFLQTKVVPHVC